MRIPGLALIALIAVLPQEPEKGPLRVTVPLETVRVRVTDSKGQEIGGLRSEDFAIYENGQLQKISVFSSKAQPHSLGMLLDKSGSMIGGAKIERAKAAARELIRASHPGTEFLYLPLDDEALPDVALLISRPFLY